VGGRIQRVLIAAIVLGMLGTACGDNGEDPPSPDGQTTQPEPEAPSVIDEGELATCLEDAGLEVVTTGDLPILGGVSAIGLRLSQGANIGPGDLSGALFVHASEADALAAEDIGIAYAVITHVRNVLIVFDPAPTDDERETVLGCASGGTLG
jgi:hypothetical protein